MWFNKDNQKLLRHGRANKIHECLNLRAFSIQLT